MSLCAVCGTAAAKYKCAGCQLPHCSLPCYRAHCPSCEHGGKAAARAPAPTAPGSGAAPESAQEAADEDELQACLPGELLARLCADPGVASAMGDPRLRRILAAIDQAPDRVAALEAFKRSEGAPFRGFLDDILVALGVAQRVALEGGGWGTEFLGLPPQARR
jgi:hypothetical protein